MASRNARRNINQRRNNTGWQKRYTEIIPLEESWKRIILRKENIQPLQRLLVRASVTNDRRTKQLILLLQDTNKAKLLQACQDVTELINNIKKHNAQRRVEKAQKKQARLEEKLRQKIKKHAEEKKQHYEWNSSASAFGDLHESSDEEEEMPEQENIHGLQFLEPAAPAGVWKSAPQIAEEKNKTPEELAASAERSAAFLARLKARKAAQGNKSWADIADDHDDAQKAKQEKKKVSWADMADSSDEEDSDDEE